MDTSNLAKRMKDYESVAKTKLMRRTPVAIRIDGKAFHTWTRHFRKPFDEILIQSMQETMRYLCQNIQGCVFGYTQSDEITLILTDYATFETAAWFDYKVQKICSITASMATFKFNQIFQKTAWEHCLCLEGGDPFADTLFKAVEKGAMFDTRCFNISKEEVCNLIYWRQLDAIRNSIQMVGQANFSHKELQNKSCKDIREMLNSNSYMTSWEDYPIHQQRGTACYKDVLGHWVLDKEMPILKGDGRDYVDQLI